MSHPFYSHTLFSPADRSFSFQAVQGGPERRNGSLLLIEAYAAIWILVLGWLLLLKREQRALRQKLDKLEQMLSTEEQASCLSEDEPPRP